MTCYSDFALESVFILNTDLEKILKDGGQHLKSCSFCRERFEELAGFYTEYENYLKNNPSRRELILAESIGESCKKSKIIAYPIPVLYPDSAEIPGLNILAAGMSSPEPNPDYNLLGVMATADKRVLVRYLRPFGSTKTSLYLISDQLELCSYVPVRLHPQLRDYISDGSGKIILDDENIININDMQLEIMEPEFIYKFSGNEKIKFIESRSIKLKFRNNNNSFFSVEIKLKKANMIDIFISETGDLNNLNYKMLLIYSDAVSEIKPFQNGCASFSKVPIEELFEIRIFTRY